MTREVFATKMALLAEMCNKALSTELLGGYDDALKGLGYPALCNALDKLIVERGDRDPFPSVRTIREIVQPTVNPEHEAVEAANRIVEAMSTFGWARPSEARAYIGELGWAVVLRSGGWETICEGVTMSQLPSYRAQWRESAKALYGRVMSGTHDEPPTIGPGRDPRKLVDTVTNKLKLVKG